MSGRAQTEIFGLVLIVLLVSVGLLFALIVMLQPPSEEVVRVRESLLAANFLNAVLGTTVEDCGGRSVRELLRNCALSSGWSSSLRCGDTNACERVDEIVDGMLAGTLGSWGKSYVFFIDGSESVERIRVESGDCSGEREGHSRPEKVAPGLDIVVTLHICR